MTTNHHDAHIIAYVVARAARTYRNKVRFRCADLIHCWMDYLATNPWAHAHFATFRAVIRHEEH